MQRSLKLRKHSTSSPQKPARGYMLITLMLAMALISMALLAVLPAIKQQIRRDQEEEMRHRGTAYMRAIQHFYKKLGRYPSRIEDLESTNNVRFLRKRYTDPINRDPKTGKERDFKLLHQQDISLNNGPVLGQVPGQGGLGGAQGQGGLGGMASQLGGAQGQAGLAGLASQLGGLQQMGAGAQTPMGGNSLNASSANADQDAGGNPNASGSSSSSSSSPNSSSNPGSGLNGQTFGGGPILGVASLSKEKSVRVFYQKNHYNDWLFIYVPTADRGGLLVGPVNPGVPTNNLGGAIPGQAVSGGQIGGPGQGLSNPNQLQNTPTPPSPSPVQTSPQQ
jgi:type II secretory pathway pseudopilin PulG